MDKKNKKRTSFTEYHLCKIPYIKTPPWIDGKISPVEWKNTEKFDYMQDITSYLTHQYNISSINPEQFNPEPESGIAEVKTLIQCCHDNNNLYIAFTCHDNTMKNLRVKDHGFGTNIEEEDYVCVWIDSLMKHQIPLCSMYAVNAAGQKKEILLGKLQTNYESIMSWEARVSVAEKTWTAEMVIPLERLKINISNQNYFGINFLRGYRGKWKTHALFKPDGNFMPGWGVAILLSQNNKSVDFIIPLIEKELEIIKKKINGELLLTNPGSLREKNTFVDENAMIGISVWGPESQPTISVGRSDCYDRRWYGNEGKKVTREEVIEAANSGEKSRLDELRKRCSLEQYGAYQQFPAPKPGAQIIFFLNELFEGSSVIIPFKDDNGIIHIRSITSSTQLNLFIYVHKRLNLIIVDGKQDNLSGKVLKIRLYRHNDNPKKLRR